MRRFARGLRDIFTACRNTPNMSVLLTAGVIGRLAAGVLAPVLPLFLHSRGLTLQGLGVMFSIGALAPVVLQPLMGWLTDRIGRKLLIVVSSISLSVMLPIYVFLGNLRAFAVLHAARSAISASTHPAFDAMMGDIMPGKQRATLFGVYGSVKDLAYVVALFSSGYLLRLGVDYNASFYFSSGLFMVASLVLAFWLKETKHLADEQARAGVSRVVGGQTDSFVDYCKFILGSRELLGLILLRFFFVFGLACYPMYVPLLSRQFGAPVEAIGPIVATAWLTFAIMQPIGGRLSDEAKSGRVGLMLIGLGMLVVAGTMIGLSSTLVMLVVFWAATGIGDGLFRPGYFALMVDLIPADGRGKYFGASGAVMTVGNVVAPLVYGFVAQKYGMSTAILISPVAWAVALILTIMLLSAQKTKQRAPVVGQ